VLVIFVTSYDSEGRNLVVNMLLYVVLGSKILAVEISTAQHYCKGISKVSDGHEPTLTCDERFMTH
jgi:hypothetical protein